MHVSELVYCHSCVRSMDRWVCAAALGLLGGVEARAVRAALGGLKHGLLVELALLTDFEASQVESTQGKGSKGNHDACADETGLKGRDLLVGNSVPTSRATVGVLVTGTVDGYGSDSVHTLVRRTCVGIVGSQDHVCALLD